MSISARIESFLKSKGIRAAHENGRSYIFDCPTCGGHQKLYVQKEDGLSVCFKRKDPRCPKPGSSAEYALSLLSNIPFKIVQDEIRHFKTQLKDDLEIPSLDEDEKIAKKIDLKAGQLPADVKFIHDTEAVDGLKYLEGRGLDLDVLKSVNVMYSPGMRRVIFPVIMSDKLVGWQGRAIDPVDKSFRMYNMEGTWRAHTLMFYHTLKHKDFLIIAEGPVSALKFGHLGNFVATMGKEVSSSQLDLIIDLNIKNIFLALDRDAVDKVHSIRQSLVSKSANPIKVFVIDIPQHRDDFGDCTFDECEEAFFKAEEVTGDEIMSFIDISGMYAKK